MADVITVAVRSRMMAGIKDKNTKPEIKLRQALHARGFRFRLHDKHLPGRPDLIFPKYRAAVFVHGCFWHGHECRTFRWPKTRDDWWRSKIEANRRRDAEKVARLVEAGWRVGVVWECALRATPRLMDAPADCARWLQSEDTDVDVTS